MSEGIATKRRPTQQLAHRAGLLIAFLFIIANSVFALLMFHQARQANGWLAHEQDLMLALQNLRELVHDAGSDQRGYLFTGDPQFLDAYQRADDSVPEALAKLRALVAKDADQRSQLAALAARLGEDRTRLADGITQAQAGTAPRPTPSELIASRLRTDELDNSIRPMLAAGQQLVSERVAAAEYRNAMMLAVISAGTLLSLIAICLMFYRLRREASARVIELADADAALRESEQWFRRIFEESPIGLLLAHRDTRRIVQANPAFCRMLGYQPEELIGRIVDEITHRDDRDMLLNAGKGTADGDHFVEQRYLTRAGAVTWARVRKTLLRTSDTRETLALGLVEDITRQKQAEAELRQAQKMEAIGQLTGGIAHDFNNLLGVIIGNVEFLLDALQERPDEADLAKEILDSALSGADLTRRLLAFARRQTLQPRRIDLNAYLPNHVAILRRVLGETTQITTTFASDLWPTRADPSQVGDALLNLAINARDAMPHGGSISIETANAHVDSGTHVGAGIGADDGDMAPGDYIVLSVTDTGTGMAPELLERIVEPFFTTKGPGVGSGLGLSMIYGFAKQSGGHLRIDSELGHGTTVRLYLPRALDEETDDREIADDPSLPRGNESILLVDDNAEMRAVGRRHLASLGYRVTEAESGPAALALLRGQDRYDLLFTDVAMPHGVTGYQLAAAARQLQPGLKVLFTTGYAGPRTKTEPAGLPPGAMICKPYRKQELAMTMRAALKA